MRNELLVKKLKPTNLTEYTGETQARTLAANIKPIPATWDDFNYDYNDQYFSFKGYPYERGKSGSIFDWFIFNDEQLNGNWKINFIDGFYWNSLQINPSIKYANLARDGVFNYPTIIGDLESGTGDDNKNGMLVGLYAKNENFEIMCGTEFELGKTSSISPTFAANGAVAEYTNINSFLTKYSTMPLAYLSTSFPTSAFTVTETLNDNGGTGFPMTQVCNA